MSPQFLQVLILLRRGLGGDRAETGRHLSGDPLPAFLGPAVLGFGRVCPMTAGLHREWAWSGMAGPAVACFSPVQQACCAQLRPYFPTSLRNAALAGAMFDTRPCISSSRAERPQSDLKKPKQLRRSPQQNKQMRRRAQERSVKTQRVLKDSRAEVTICPPL